MSFAGIAQKFYTSTVLQMDANEYHAADDVCICITRSGWIQSSIEEEAKIRFGFLLHSWNVPPRTVHNDISPSSSYQVA